MEVEVKAGDNYQQVSVCIRFFITAFVDDNNTCFFLRIVELSRSGYRDVVAKFICI